MKVFSPWREGLDEEMAKTLRTGNGGASHSLSHRYSPIFRRFPVSNEMSFEHSPKHFIVVETIEGNLLKGMRQLNGVYPAIFIVRCVFLCMY